MSKSGQLFLFRPNNHKALWGNESWEVSVHRAGESVVADGPFAGKKLSEILSGFPLLVKVIDTNLRLSVQVHPSERTCRITGGEPKTEMWCMLNDGCIYAGLKPGVGPAEVEAAVASGRFEELLVRHEAKAGDVFFIPGGLIHAIGENTRLYEVQQSSDTTFRLYDWDRVGADGKKRTLHVRQALEATDYSLRPPSALNAVACPFFRFDKVELNGREEIATDGGFCVLYAARGGFTLDGRKIAEGQSVLAADCSSLSIEGENALVFLTRKGVA